MGIKPEQDDDCDHHLNFASYSEYRGCLVTCVLQSLFKHRKNNHNNRNNRIPLRFEQRKRMFQDMKLIFPIQ